MIGTENLTCVCCTYSVHVPAKSGVKGIGAHLVGIDDQIVYLVCKIFVKYKILVIPPPVAIKYKK